MQDAMDLLEQVASLASLSRLCVTDHRASIPVVRGGRWSDQGRSVRGS